MNNKSYDLLLIFIHQFIDIKHCTKPTVFIFDVIVLTHCIALQLIMLVLIQELKIGLFTN